jgi:uncharacterized lipoprotein YddW (UPF0748 family)
MVREGLTRGLAALIALAAPIATLCACGLPSVPEGARTEEPPPAPREFRAAWVATVANIDWPSKAGLPVEEQRAEIVRIVDRAAELRLNALVVQVRTTADAMYPSKIEPWSEYLTGEQGKPPEPFYDPLKEWIDEAHRRGIELHAWFNPYRARHVEAKSPLAKSHIAMTHPEAVKSYGGYLWMDPGDAAAVDQTLRVVVDVVHRYDVDGVHIDDYFYPYPVRAREPSGEEGAEEDFPDDPTWQAYVSGGGTLGRADWRRKNVSDLIERLYTSIHHEKSWVKYGISPFGLGRPDRRPPEITGFSQYDKLYADVELWLENGWLDYLSPQLYWRMSQTHQAFGPLLDYWRSANPRGRHVWPGLFTSKIDSSAQSWTTDEVLGQIRLTRERTSGLGQVHFSMISLLENRKGIADRLKAGPYATDALVPATPWLDGTRPKAPRARVASGEGVVKLALSVLLDKPTPRYAVWTRYGAVWRFEAVPTNRAEIDLAPRSPDGALESIVVSVIDRVGNESERVHLSTVRAP